MMDCNIPTFFISRLFLDCMFENSLKVGNALDQKHCKTQLPCRQRLAQALWRSAFEQTRLQTFLQISDNLSPFQSNFLFYD